MFTAKNFDYLLGLPGFSDQMLKNHLALYQGYVNNSNKLWEELNKMSQDNTLEGPIFNELIRRFGWEFNGMRLHEIYFDNLSPNSQPLDRSSLLAKKITQQFGSLDNWKNQFQATGLLRGIGWVILCYDPQTDFLFNTWIDEHNTGHLTGAKPLLVMDVFEHAFMLDYGLKRADYIEAFFKNINWLTVAQRIN
ncbi:MAG TPA: superoxide dismutase [Candidatus Magasanikbacteria bacterium]|nr:superoxide dismutase [Candidatus Magasanikbacteria bacterium]